MIISMQLQLPVVCLLSCIVQSFVRHRADKADELCANQFAASELIGRGWNGSVLLSHSFRWTGHYRSGGVGFSRRWCGSPGSVGRGRARFSADAIRSGNEEAPEDFVIADSEGREIEIVPFAAVLPKGLKY